MSRSRNSGSNRCLSISAVCIFGLVPARTSFMPSSKSSREGFSTVCAVTVKEVAQQIRVPRSVFINFPFGRTLGPAHDTPLQESIVADMARALKTLDRPGKMINLPYRWSGRVA